MKDLLNCDGKRFKATIIKATCEGVISVEKNKVYLCQDKPYLELRMRKPKARYIKLLGNRHENKEMMSVLADKIKPYPKRAQLKTN